MLSDADLPKSYWLEALNYAVLLHNVSPSKSLGTTPTEEYTGTKPDVSRLCVFGCVAHVHVPEQVRGKLSACSMTCTFLGFAQQYSVFHLVHRPTQKFLESRDIVFNEGGPSPHHEHIILKPDNNTPLPSPPPNPAAPSHPKHATRPPVRDDDPCYDVSSYGHQANIALADASEPKTYNEAMASPDAPKWLTTCEEEMRTWKDLDVYDIVPQLKGRKGIGSKWVFHVKRGPDGSIQKHKARIVAQGFTQVEGINFDQTFAPVVKFSSLRTVFALAAEHDLELHQMDVKATYLNADLKEDLYMEAPPGFKIPDGHVLKLKKGGYGTKQGGHIWYEDMRGTLSELGYTRTEVDHTVFVRPLDGIPDIITLYMDDMGLILESLCHQH